MPTRLEQLGRWTLSKGLHIVWVVTFTIIATRVIRWIAGRISRRLSDADDGGTTVRSEAAKHRQAVASLISSVAISLLYVMVAGDTANQIGLPLRSPAPPPARPPPPLGS